MSREQLGSNGSEGCVAPGLGEEAPVASGGATRTLLASEQGVMHLWDAASGVDYTLPAPVAGMVFKFYASVAVTSNSHAISTDSASTFIGGTVQQVIAASGTSEGQVGDETSDVTIAMNGTTTGGLKGTYIEVVALSSTAWVARNSTLVSSGTLATPFA